MELNFRDIDRYIEDRTEAHLRKLGESAHSIEEAEENIAKKVATKYRLWLGYIGIGSFVTFGVALWSLYGFVEEKSATAAVTQAKEDASKAIDDLEKEFKQSSDRIEELHKNTIAAMAKRIEDLGAIRKDLERIDSLLPVLKSIDLEKAKANAALLSSSEERIQTLLRSDTRLNNLDKKIDENTNVINELIPVGSIVISILPPRIFGETVNGTDSFDPEVARWLPADGRGVAGSIYGKARSNTPDLRGVFIRGLNEFQQGIKVKKSRGDTEENRKAGEFQPDSAFGHSHMVFADKTDHLDPDIDKNRVKRDEAAVVGNRHKGSLNISDYQIIGTKVTPTVGRSSQFGELETRPRNVAVYFYIKVN